MKKLMLLVPLLFVSGLLGACASSPEPGYYTLGPVPGTVSTDVKYVVKVARPTLAGYLDRPDIARQAGAYQVTYDGTANWASPLDKMFQQVLADDIQQRLPGATVLAEDDLAASPVRFIVDSDIQQFNPVDSRHAVLRAQMTVTDKTAHEQPDGQMVQMAAEGGASSSATAAALSQLVGRYADQVIAVLRTQDARNAASAAKPVGGVGQP